MQYVNMYPLRERERDTDHWSQIFVGRTRDLLHPCAAVHIPFFRLCCPRVASPQQPPPPLDKSWVTPHPQQSPFHCYNKAIRVHGSHDPDPKPLFYPSYVSSDICETFESGSLWWRSFHLLGMHWSPLMYLYSGSPWYVNPSYMDRENSISPVKLSFLTTCYLLCYCSAFVVVWLCLYIHDLSMS